MGPDITFCPAIAAQLKPSEHGPVHSKVRRSTAETDLMFTDKACWAFDPDEIEKAFYLRPPDSGSTTRRIENGL